jgi:hypothetical protein
LVIEIDAVLPSGVVALRGRPAILAGSLSLRLPLRSETSARWGWHYLTGELTQFMRDEGEGEEELGRLLGEEFGVDANL